MSDIFGGASASGAADPDLMQRLLRYTGASPVDPRLAGGGPPAGPPPDQQPNAFQGAFGNIHDWLAARMAGGQANAAIADPRQRAIADAGAQLNAGPPLNINNQPTLGPNNPIAQAAAIPPNLPPAAAAPPFHQPDHPSTMRYPMWPTPPVPAAASPVASAPLPPVRPKNLGQPVRRTPPATTRIPASATASVPPAARSPFVPVAAQNQDWSGGALSRYGTSGFGRQGTALDLSKLFSRQ